MINNFNIILFHCKIFIIEFYCLFVIKIYSFIVSISNTQVDSDSDTASL